MSTRHRRRGSALLDVVIALAVLGLSGTALITLVGQTAHTMRKVRDTERELRLATDELSRFAIYDRSQLVAMAGRFVERGWTISVGQPFPDVFDVAVARSDGSGALLMTSVYRPDTTRAPAP